MLLLKLALVALSVLLATEAAKRFGHRVGGAVAGMPMIAAPITAVLLVDQSAEQVRAIAVATLACLPAALLHIVTFAHAASRLPWFACVSLALLAYVSAASVLSVVAAAPLVACVAGAIAPSLGWLASPRHAAEAGVVVVPRSEFVLRIAAALLMATAVILGAATLPPAVSGLLLAVPITGTVLPCFTLPRYGPQATASLLSGFTQGFHGFAAFFVVLVIVLPVVSKGLAFLLALSAALLAAIAVQSVRRLVFARAAR